jgi:hypothetical protein
MLVTVKKATGQKAPGQEAQVPGRRLQGRRQKEAIWWGWGIQTKSSLSVARTQTAIGIKVNIKALCPLPSAFQVETLAGETFSSSTC